MTRSDTTLVFGKAGALVRTGEQNSLHARGGGGLNRTLKSASLDLRVLDFKPVSMFNHGGKSEV